MARVMIAESILQDVANAIRTASSTSETMRPIDFANKILSLSGGGDSSVYCSADTYVSSSTLSNDGVTADKLVYAYFPYMDSTDGNLFSDYTNLVAISAPNLTSIPAYFLRNCSQLASVSFPSVTSVQNYALQSCYMLNRIDLPNCTSVEEEAFMNFNGDIHFAAANESAIKQTAWYQMGHEGASRAYFDLYASGSSGGGSGSVYCSEGSTVTNDTMTNEGYDEQSRTSIKYVFLPNAISLGDDTFQYCEQLTQIYLPKVETLSETSIYAPASLTEIHLPYTSKENIEQNFPSTWVDGKEVHEVRFGNATTYFDLYADTSDSFTFTSESATSIGDNFFRENTNLTGASFPACLTVGTQAFQSCSALTSIELPQATTIGDGAFNSCSALTSIELPQATTIGDSAFQSCSALTSIELGFETIDSWTLPFLNNAKDGFVLNLPKCNNITSSSALSNASCSSQIHFAAANQATIEACDGYSNKFGASSATIYFDL